MSFSQEMIWVNFPWVQMFEGQFFIIICKIFPNCEKRWFFDKCKFKLSEIFNKTIKFWGSWEGCLCQNWWVQNYWKCLRWLSYWEDFLWSYLLKNKNYKPHHLLWGTLTNSSHSDIIPNFPNSCKTNRLMLNIMYFS